MKAMSESYAVAAAPEPRYRAARRLPKIVQGAE